VVPSSRDRLPQGYTNRTRRVVGRDVVEKFYEGSDGGIRLLREAQCLRLVTGVLPVPTVVDKDDEHCLLRLAWIAGTPAQLLIDAGSAHEVLAAAGALLRRLQTDGTPLLAPSLSGSGAVAVHGDFGPQNLLFDADCHVVGVVDWEFAHIGDAVEDLAWCEWIVRMHHPVEIDALNSLFAGYGERPLWSSRQSAMVVQCEFFRERCEREGWVDADVMWRTRLRTTNSWNE
jgi:aminoglycoside phosphotransferase